MSQPPLASSSIEDYDDFSKPSQTKVRRCILDDFFVTAQLAKVGNCFSDMSGYEKCVTFRIYVVVKFAVLINGKC